MMKLLNKLKALVMRYNLMRELVLMFTLVSSIVLILGSLLCYNAVLKILQQRSEENTIQQFRQLDYNMNAFFNQVNEISKMILANPAPTDIPYIQELINHEGMSQGDLIQLLNNINRGFTQSLQNYSFIHSIFAYTENGDIVGCTHTLNETVVDGDGSQFVYTSGIYRSAIDSYPSMAWVAGNRITDMGVFGDSELEGQALKPSVISAVRGIKSFYNGGFGGVIVINIDQSELAKTYTHLFESQADSAYIVDAGGKIISSVDSSSLGEKSAAFGRLSADTDFGSFTLERPDADAQVIYYRIKSVGWTLLEEIPLSRYANDIANLKRIIVLIFLLNFCLIILISAVLLKRITKPLDTLTSAMKRLGKGDLGISVSELPKNEFGILASQFNQMSANIARLVSEKEEIEREKRKHEILALQTQINPHFIYNTVNTIKYMSVIANASNIADSLTVFANLLRPLFKNPSNFCAMEEEVEYLQNYIKIMNYRYGNTIRLNMEVPAELMKYKILRFILQPLLENTLQHGMSMENGLHLINIKAVSAGGNINITISDNGLGIPPDKLREIRESIEAREDGGDGTGMGIGLHNINQRLKLHFGGDYRLKIESVEGSGTDVTLSIPEILK